MKARSSSLLTRFLFVFYFLEVGLALVVLPWWPPAVWERNYFVQAIPAIGLVARNYYVRGAVSGLGVVTLLAGLADLLSLFRVIVGRRA